MPFACKTPVKLIGARQANKKISLMNLGFIVALEKTSDIGPDQGNKKYSDDKAQHVTNYKPQCRHGVE